VDLLILALLVTALVLPFRWAVMQELAYWESAEYFRRFGVIIRRPEALQACTEVIGRYQGAPIHRSVTFKGMEYEFAGVVPPRYQDRIDESELYLDPGLLYLVPQAPAQARAPIRPALKIDVTIGRKFDVHQHPHSH
jgi:hypothetical protein